MIFVTGSSGFIGYHVALRLLERGERVVGLDAMTPYYDVALKRARLARLAAHPGFRFIEADLNDRAALASAMADRPRAVIHLAAQAGVRYSITHPDAYVDTNVGGTFALLEACRAWPVDHLIIASTSSVYGANDTMPFRETDKADTPLTLYAATKKATEAMAHSYAHLFGTPTTAARFFTVYGPWGRPDMALFKFTSAILEGRPIEVFNGGEMTRDFTYIDDVVEALLHLVDRPPVVGAPVAPEDTLSPVAPFRVVNMGGGAPVHLGRFIELIEAAVGREAIKVLLPMQEGDVPATAASPALLEALIGRVPSTPVEVGVPAFVDWYRRHYTAAGAERALLAVH
jgi:UDP-glucuronate 4-epimerase